MQRGHARRYIATRSPYPRLEMLRIDSINPGLALAATVMGRCRRWHLGAVGAVFASATFIPPSPALAQTALIDQTSAPDGRASFDAARPSTPVHSKVDDSAGRLDEIVVTAQHRSERLQDVPLAVTSLSSKALDRLNVSSTSDLSQVVPSLVFSSTINVASPFIRGVGSRLIDPTSESAVSIYVDDVYMAAPQANIFTLLGIKQIDVLSGPQGTLFGRNATGGVIQVQTLDPGHTPHLDASLTYAKYDFVSVPVYASTGIGDHVATSLSALYENQGKGYGRNLFDGSATFLQARDNITVRNKWAIDPSEHTKIRVVADYARLSNTWAFQKPPGSFSPVAGASSPIGYPGRFNADADQNDFTRIRTGGVSVKVDQDFGPVTLTSISAYRKNRGANGLDQDVSTAAALDFSYIEQFHNYSQELRIGSSAKTPLTWLVGAYYYQSAGAFAPLYINGKNTIPFDQQRDQSLAAFAQGTARLFKATELTLGIRYTTEDQRFAFPAANVRLRQSVERPTYRVALDHHITSDLLAYASYTTGFKSGGYNLLQPGRSYRPERLDALEVGAKAELLDHKLRLTTDGFYYWYRDQQVNIAAPGGSVVANAAGSHIRGVEATFEYRPTGRLEFAGAASIIKGGYTSYPGFQLLDDNGAKIGAPIDVKGNTTVQTPKFVGNLLTSYQIPTDFGLFVPTIGAQHNSGFWWDAGNKVRQPAYTIVNASISWASTRAPFDLKLWVKNLLNDTYFLNSSIGAAPVGINQEQAPPRTFGATVSVHI